MPARSELFVALATLLYVLWNQRQVRPARTTLGLPLALAGLGALSLYAYSLAHPLSHLAVTLIAVSLVFDAVGLGALRAYTVRLWSEGGTLVRQGTWLTIGLWVVGFAIHFALGQAGGVGSVSDLLYLGLTLLAQRRVLQGRAAGLAA